MVKLFYLLIAVLPLENHWLWRFELLGSFTLLKALGIVCLFGAVASAFQTGFRTELFRNWTVRLYLVYLGIQCASYFVHGGNVDVELMTYMNVLSVVSLGVVTLISVDSPLKLRRTVLLGIGGAAFASLYTIRGQQGAPDISGFRPSGIFDDANYYALVVGLWIPMAFLWSLRNNNKVERTFCIGSLAAMLLGTTFAASRGGFLGLAASLLFMVFHSRRRARNFAVLIAVMVPLLVLAPNSPLRRLLEPRYSDVQAADARLVAWTAGMRMVRAHPLVGVGLGNFKAVMPKYEDPGANVISVAHNTYIEDAAELGIPTLFIHLGVLFTAFFSFGRVRRRAVAVRWTYLYQIALGLQAGLLSYMVGAFFVSSWWQKIPWLLLFLAAPLEIVAAQSIKQRLRRRSAAAGKREVISDQEETEACRLEFQSLA